MIPSVEEKQISVRINDLYASRLDVLAKGGGIPRNHLMLSFVNLWMKVLGEAEFSHIFYIANLLRVREEQSKGNFVYEHEFSESGIPEKPLPMKFTETDISNINKFANFSHISRHSLLKTMIIVGIEELEKLIDNKPYKFGEIEAILSSSFSKIMKKGFKAFKAYQEE